MIVSGTANLSSPRQLVGLIALKRFGDYIESTNLLVDVFCGLIRRLRLMVCVQIVTFGAFYLSIVEYWVL